MSQNLIAPLTPLALRCYGARRQHLLWSREGSGCSLHAPCKAGLARPLVLPAACAVAGGGVARAPRWSGVRHSRCERGLSRRTWARCRDLGAAMRLLLLCACFLCD